LPVRIYALAKELKIDSKKLVDVCAQAGIPDKGSALASLSDEEADKIKALMSGGGKPAGRKARAGAGDSSEKSADQGAVRREDYIGPSGSGKVPVLGGKAKEPSSESPAAGAGPKEKETHRSGPSIKLAPLPAAEKSAPSVKPVEPAPQKPDLKLPADAIRASKAGSKPLAAHLRRQEEARESPEKPAKTKTRGRGGRGVGLPSSPEEILLPSEGRERGRRGKAGGHKKDEEVDRALLGGREQRQLSRKRQGEGKRSDSQRMSYRPRRTKRAGVSTAAPRKENVVVQLPCTVRSLSEAAGVPAASILRILLQEGIMGTIASELDPEITELIAAELDLNVAFAQPVSLEEELLAKFKEEEDTAQLVARPPVITFLGHVDHGKTSLLDRLIGTDVVSGESGGITQHIRAYEISRDERRIAFVDTPGHEAFTEMRARGANVTDIAVLVVAADDGVMPQTEEAISHARAAEVPIVVALNKIDLPGIDVNRVLQQLSASDLLPSEWGGDVEVVRTSATTGEGMEELLDTLLTVAELHDYQANPSRPAQGTCLEAQQEGGRGVVAKLIVQQGTLKIGDVVVCGQAYGRVKALYDTLRPEEQVSDAGPSTPVNMTGLDEAPGAGDRFYVMDDIAKARMIAQSRATAARETVLGVGPQHVTLENLFERLGGNGEVRTLNMILRADVRGSIEAIQNELTKLEHPEVRIKVLQATVGGITEADVHLADASDAIIIGFNVVPDEGARLLADQRGVQIRRYDVIYKITDDLKAALEGMLEPEQREVELGRALVQQAFKISRIGTVAGCRVLSGTVERNSRARVIRDNTIIGDYQLDTLRREKDDAKEVREGMECGIKLKDFDDVKEADVFEVYRLEEVGRKFDER